MSDSYWRYTDPRQPPPSSIPPLVGKRPRSDYEARENIGKPLLSLVAMSSLVIIHGTMIKEQCGQPEIVTPLENLMIVTFAARGSQSGRPMSGGMPGRAVDDPRMVGIGGLDPGQTIKDRTIGFGSGRPEPPLPPDASSTLFVEGLPPDCTRREVSRILSLAII
ncbi:Coiled-coil domain-containing protein [Gossypium arboreum]|uniref:Coiled-coil domain-containing protein n=1 Tax=Gossypium arboreum TaxID=29729 RepID=A0A0B0MYC4_GOSAR|nr:Coiled-coil domain-containing protein [Gossypium arboreum]